MNVATILRTSLVIVSTLTSVGAVCTGGIAGVEAVSQPACCVEECGLCGGSGCAEVGGVNSTLTANDCCSSEILESDVFCVDTGVAPCILTADVTGDFNSTCSNDLPGFEDTVNLVCCDVACGLCGGSGCGNVVGLTGNDCCSETIATNGTLCSVAGEAPCIIDLPEVTSNNTCSNGFSGFEDTVNFVCCDVACGLCGGPGCGNVPGLTGSDCCSSTISTTGTLCSVAGEAPCILELPDVTTNNTCSNDFPGFEDSVNGVCCDAACGLCGGAGCGNVPGLTGNDCCSETIANNGTLCSLAGEAPCILDLPEVTSNSTCSNGFPGFEDTVNFVCCDVGCGLCGGPGCGNVRGLTGNDCCSETIATNGTLCSVAGEAPCILELPDVTSNDTCSNGFSGFEDTVNFVCCDAACGLCGGPGCGNVPGLTGNECCSETIATNGTLCSVAGEAPCILEIPEVTSNSTCSNGLPGFEDTVNFVCCDVACGLCGGPGCGNVPGLTGNDCCSETIATNGTSCSVAGEAPCILELPEVTSNSTCSNGLSGFEDTVNFVCCDVACGLCGGPGCGNVPGLSGDDCCSGTIATNGTLCSVTGAAPCIIDPPEVTPSMCPNGLAGVQDGNVCCAEACNGVCGGEGCGSILGTEGSSDCCSAIILEGGVFCVDGVDAPCIMVNGTFTPAPSFTTAMPTITPREVMFTAAPTVEGQTEAPTQTPTQIPTPTPTAAPSALNVSVPTAAPSEASMAPTVVTTPQMPTPGPLMMNTSAPTSSGATTPSTGNLVTFAALVVGTFAIFAAARH
ncbi:unnamed protein product [Ascophyllum nodosum]